MLVGLFSSGSGSAHLDCSLSRAPIDSGATGASQRGKIALPARGAPLRQQSLSSPAFLLRLSYSLACLLAVFSFLLLRSGGSCQRASLQTHPASSDSTTLAAASLGPTVFLSRSGDSVASSESIGSSALFPTQSPSRPSSLQSFAFAPGGAWGARSARAASGTSSADLKLTLAIPLLYQ